MTNSEIRDKDLRQIAARELMTLRWLRKKAGTDLKSDFYIGGMVGFFTALRRVQMERDNG